VTTVGQVLKEKGHAICSVAPGDTVFEALGVMAEFGIGALVVLEDRRLVGIFSERDYARKIILQDKRSHDTYVREVMTTALICVGPTQMVDECMHLMTEKRVRHLPVLEGEELVGVVSIGDIVKAMMVEQKRLIEQLEGYIKSGG